MAWGVPQGFNPPPPPPPPQTSTHPTAPHSTRCLILRFSVAEISEGDLTAKEGLLLWAQKKVAEGSGGKGEVKAFDASQVLVRRALPLTPTLTLDPNPNPNPNPHPDPNPNPKPGDAALHDRGLQRTRTRRAGARVRAESARPAGLPYTAGVVLTTGHPLTRVILSTFHGWTYFGYPYRGRSSSSTYLVLTVVLLTMATLTMAGLLPEPDHADAMRLVQQHYARQLLRRPGKNQP